MTEDAQERVRRTYLLVTTALAEGYPVLADRLTGLELVRLEAEKIGRYVEDVVRESGQ